MFIFQQYTSKVAGSAFDDPQSKFNQIVQSFEKNPQDLNLAIIQVNSILSGKEKNFSVVLGACASLLELASIAHTQNIANGKNFNVSTALSELERISLYIPSTTESFGDASTTFIYLKGMCLSFWMGVNDKNGQPMEEDFILQNYKMPLSNLSLEKFFSERILMPAARHQIYSITQGMKTSIIPNLNLISQLFDVLQDYDSFKTYSRLNHKQDPFLSLIIDSIKNCTTNLSEAKIDKFEIPFLESSLPRIRESISKFVGHELFIGPVSGRGRLDDDGGELQAYVFASLEDSFGSLGPSDFYLFSISQNVTQAIGLAASK